MSATNSMLGQPSSRKSQTTPTRGKGPGVTVSSVKVSDTVMFLSRQEPNLAGKMRRKPSQWRANNLFDLEFFRQFSFQYHPVESLVIMKTTVCVLEYWSNDVLTPAGRKHALRKFTERV
jgi:hypothetical protein